MSTPPYAVFTKANQEVLQSCDFHVVDRWLQSHRSAYDDRQDRSSMTTNIQASCSMLSSKSTQLPTGQAQGPSRLLHLAP